MITASDEQYTSPLGAVFHDHGQFCRPIASYAFKNFGCVSRSISALAASLKSFQVRGRTDSRSSAPHSSQEHQMSSQASFREVLQVSTAFLLCNVKSKREASLLLRVGRTAADFDSLTQHLAECINQQRTLRSTFSLVQAAQDRRTEALQPILLQAKTTNVVALRTLCAQLDACLSELSELRKSLGQFYTHNTEVAAELFAEGVQNLAAQKSTLAAVERALFDRLGALLSADEGAYRECLQTHCSPLDSSSAQEAPGAMYLQQQQQQSHTTQHAAAAAAAAAAAPITVHSLPPPASPSLSQREAAVSTPAAAVGQQRTTPTSGTSHSSSTNTSSQLSSQLSPALVTVKQKSSSSAATATVAAVAAVAAAEQQGNTDDGSGVLGITAPVLPNSRLYAAAAPGFSQDSPEAIAAAAAAAESSNVVAAAAQQEQQQQQQQQQQQHGSQQASSNTTDGVEGEAAAAADATETESEGGSQP
jgi:hypothetical protein